MNSPWIGTRSGKRFYILDSKPGDIDIYDVAHSLSRLCRYTGHCDEIDDVPIYNVADHSLRVSGICPPEDQLWGLLHDLAEFALGDLSSPVKHLPELAYYRYLEERIMDTAVIQFRLSPRQPYSVKCADRVLRATEIRDLMQPVDPEWYDDLADVTPLPDPIKPLTPNEARSQFLGRFEQLMQERTHEQGRQTLPLS